jgi:hypothetical protein
MKTLVPGCPPLHRPHLQALHSREAEDSASTATTAGTRTRDRRSNGGNVRHRAQGVDQVEQRPVDPLRREEERDPAEESGAEEIRKFLGSLE